MPHIGGMTATIVLVASFLAVFLPALGLLVVGLSRLAGWGGASALPRD